MATPKFAPLKNDLILRAARGEKVERPPMWVMRQAGRYLQEYNQVKGKHDFFEVCRTPELASTITIQPVERYEGLLDAAIIFSDILVVPQAMGMRVEMVEKLGPHFPDPLRDPKDVDKLHKKIDVRKELGYVFAALTMTRKKLNGRVPLIGFAGAPWTLMSYMIEGGGSKTFQYAKQWIFKYPDVSKDLLSRITDVCVDYLVEQVAAGAQMLQIFDSWAGELGPDDFAVFSLPYLKSLCEGVRRGLQSRHLESVPMTVFAKGAWYALEELCSIGYDTVSLDWLQDPADAVRVSKGRVTLQGNMDPSTLYGGRKAITQKVERMINGFGGGKQKYIINLGHGITPGVDPDDLKWFFQECHRVGGK